MMVVDSSAIIAILFDEPEGPSCTKALEGASSRLISAVNYVETGTVLAGRLDDRRRSKAIGILDDFLATLGIDIAPLDETVARAAQRARLDYGKGFGTRGGLNFGDCFAYALAKQHSAPLLYVGNDFGLTDIRSALKAPRPKNPKR
ncbi:type II toxin-antitoxin system VapC family toxin [Pelagibacterium sp. H642]|uniref:type II toxin-antitoxin system VapC family toxin n=1 Tax=Pelagibacterium sp. H642 TaxID=1881069 RepID=UPI002814BAA9|nr:type II toxin-antitoxin system VapC family toxin [Pelagibacterium sp. H642]WMT92590.1 type II toxin-antitoxin system VapC family toxin [Pelagibacterium sp. H642]